LFSVDNVFSLLLAATDIDVEISTLNVLTGTNSKWAAWSWGRSHGPTHRDINRLIHPQLPKLDLITDAEYVHNPDTMNTPDDFRNVSVTEVGVVDTPYGVSQPVASRRLNAGWLSCCYSGPATRQWPRSTQRDKPPDGSRGEVFSKCQYVVV